MIEPTTRTPLEAARALLHELGLRPVEAGPTMASGHDSSLLLRAQGDDGRSFLLKWYLPPRADRFYPAGTRPEDYARREVAFYRLLDRIDPERKELPAPRTVLVDTEPLPRWILIEWLRAAVGPVEEVLGMDHVFGLLRKLQAVPTERLLGQRDFPLDHWHPVSYLERIRQMYDSVLFVLGEQRWRNLQLFFGEAMRWTDGRAPVLVHGDFCEQNVIVDRDGRAFLVDFERVGMGNPDHDIAWFWIHSTRNQEWKRALVRRWLAERVGGDRIRAEWGIRSTLALLAVQRLRWGYLTHGDEDLRRSANLALLDAALSGGPDLFPG